MTTLDASPVEPWAVKTSPFGPRGGRNHNGTDLGSPNPAAIPIYGAGVYAPFDGTVTTGYEANGAGNWIWVTRNDGLLFKCFHLSAYVVTAGRVKAGQLIGRVGNTGASSGAHWHIELWSGGRPFDPWPAIHEVMTRTPEPPAVEPTPEPIPEPEADMPLTDADAALVALKVGELLSGRAQAEGQEWAKAADGTPYPSLTGLIEAEGKRWLALVNGLADATGATVEWDQGTPTFHLPDKP